METIKDELINFQKEYIKILEHECEVAFGRLFKLGHKASPESILLGKKLRTYIAQTEEKLNEETENKVA